jgi:hypothetical protein
VNRIYRPTRSAADWRDLTAGGERHWKDGHSAKCLAESWEAADGFPPRVREALAESADNTLRTARLLLAIPEWKVQIPGGGHPSQNDLLCLAGIRRDDRDELLVLMVEGKARESFGPTVAGWHAKSSPGKDRRLASLKGLLGFGNVSDEQLGDIRYQLLHRTASALLTARAFAARNALVLVHAFGSPPRSFVDFERFTGLLGLVVDRGAIVGPALLDATACYFGWVDE